MLRLVNAHARPDFGGLDEWKWYFEMNVNNNLFSIGFVKRRRKKTRRINHVCSCGTYGQIWCEKKNLKKYLRLCEVRGDNLYRQGPRDFCRTGEVVRGQCRNHEPWSKRGKTIPVGRVRCAGRDGFYEGRFTDLIVFVDDSNRPSILLSSYANNYSTI